MIEDLYNDVHWCYISNAAINDVADARTQAPSSRVGRLLA
jgi:hypothetical protein